jgi:hypothetical protein
MSTVVVVPAAPKVSFFAKVEGLLKKLFGSTTWEQTALTTLKVASPLIQGLVGLLAGENASVEATQILNEIKTDLAASIVMIQHIQTDTAPGGTAAVSAILNDASSNLSAFLAAGHIKNPQKVAQATQMVTMIVGSLQAVIALLPTK